MRVSPHLQKLLTRNSKIEQNLNNDFSNICDWFVDNKLSIHFGEDKTKCTLSGTKQKLNKTGSSVLDTVQYKLNSITL